MEVQRLGPAELLHDRDERKGEPPPGVLGALQGRRELVAGQRMIGFECTIAVPSIDDDREGGGRRGR